MAIIKWYTSACQSEFCSPLNTTLAKTQKSGMWLSGKLSTNINFYRAFVAIEVGINTKKVQFRGEKSENRQSLFLKLGE